MSFVLNGKAREKHISESLEEKVLAYMKEVGYKPNALNLGLTIPDDLGVVVFDDSSLFRLFTSSITADSQPIKEVSETVIKLL